MLGFLFRMIFSDNLVRLVCLWFLELRASLLGSLGLLLGFVLLLLNLIGADRHHLLIIAAPLCLAVVARVTRPIVNMRYLRS